MGNENWQKTKVGDQVWEIINGTEFAGKEDSPRRNSFRTTKSETSQTTDKNIPYRKKYISKLKLSIISLEAGVVSGCVINILRDVFIEKFTNDISNNIVFNFFIAAITGVIAVRKD